MNSKNSWYSTVLMVGSLLIAGCKSAPDLQQAQPAVVKWDQVPAWVDQPCISQPADVICAVGESDFAAADIEAAKTDAEAAAKNRITDQLMAQNARLTARLSSAIKDLSNGRTLGQRVLQDINSNFTQQTLSGLRFTEYFYYPDRLAPQKVFVRAILASNTTQTSQQILDDMLARARTEKLLTDLKIAIEHLERARKVYLQEQQRADLRADTSRSATQESEAVPEGPYRPNLAPIPAP